MQVIKIENPFVVQNEQSAKYQKDATSDKQIVLTDKTGIKRASWTDLPSTEDLPIDSLATLEGADPNTGYYFNNVKNHSINEEKFYLQKQMLSQFWKIAKSKPVGRPLEERNDKLLFVTQPSTSQSI